MATAVTHDAPARINPPTTAEGLLEWPDEDPGEIVDGVFEPRYPDGVVTGAGAARGVVALGIGCLVGNHAPRGVLEGPPDLAVEVLSPTNRPARVARKVADYLAHGVALVWEVDPDARTITVHRPAAAPYVRRGGDVLDGGDVLRGFCVATAEVFTDLDPEV